MMKHILMSFARCISHQTRGFPVLCWISLWYSSPTIVAGAGFSTPTKLGHVIRH